MQLFDTSSRPKIDLTHSAWSDAGQAGQYSDSGAGAYFGARYGSHCPVVRELSSPGS
jgi:hypothetical protein